jgi:diguanylate cyclase (GGDEF)-like protein/PAS domain S-box-containing protein
MEWAPLSPPVLLGDTPVQLLAAIVESSDDAIVAKRLDGTVLSWNRGAEELYGYSAREMVGQNIAAVIPADRADELVAILARVGAGEHIQHHETVRRRKDGSVLDVSVTISPILDAAGEVVGASTIARNITQQKRIQRLLAHRALHDALTNLPNRVLLRDRIEGALARAQRNGSGVAVFFLDLDGFKVLNDTHGHAAGDEILRVVAERLREAVRTDDTVARFGGDEFVIVCHDVLNEDRATRIALRVAAAVAVPVTLHEQQEVVVRASIGVVLGRPGALPDVLVHDADTAMYEAKLNTRDGEAK